MEKVGASGASYDVALSWMQDKINRGKQTPNLLRVTAGQVSCSIFKPHSNLMKCNRDMYEPSVVSIGPYYHRKDHLMMIEEHKPRYLGLILSWVQERGINLRDIFGEVAKEEDNIRNHYAEVIKYSPQELIEMVTFDSCFVLVMLFINEGLLLPDNDDPIMKLPWVLPLIKRDFLKLGNQVPFFILEELYLLLKPSPHRNDGTFGRMIMRFFGYDVRAEFVMERCMNFHVEHLLDFYRWILIARVPNEQINQNLMNIKPIRSATKLRQHGIKFRVIEDGRNFVDVRFNHDGGVVEIPKLVVDNFFTLYLLNAIEFEQSYSLRSKHMTTYVYFLGCLLNSGNDVEFLIDKKIIENCFGTDTEVSQFIQLASKDIHMNINQSYLASVFNGVNHRCESTCQVRWADFKQIYFETSWSFLSVGASILFFMLGVLQVLFATLNYFRPPK